MGRCARHLRLKSFDFKIAQMVLNIIDNNNDYYHLYDAVTVCARVPLFFRVRGASSDCDAGSVRESNAPAPCRLRRTTAVAAAVQ